MSCPTGGAIGSTVSYSNIIVSQAGTGGSFSAANGYIGVESNTNFFNRWYDSMETRYSIMFTYQEIEYLKNNLDMVPKVEAAIQNLSPRPAYMSLKDIAERSPNLKSIVGKHVMTLFDQLLYPKFTEIVKRLPSFVVENEKVMKELKLYTGYNESEITEKLRFGFGPQIYIMSLPSNVVGRFKGDEDPNYFKINIAFVQEYEQMQKPSTNQALGFFLAATNLHEFVHQARFLNGLNDWRNGVYYEFGDGFERDAFGLDVQPYTQSLYEIKFFKR